MEADAAAVLVSRTEVNGIGIHLRRENHLRLMIFVVQAEDDKAAVPSSLEAVVVAVVVVATSVVDGEKEE